MTPNSEQVVILDFSVAEKINALHDELCSMGRMSIVKASEAGELLVKHKTRLKHGQWLPWCQENLRFSRQTVDNYVRVFKDYQKLPTVGNLELTEAYRFLSGRPSGSVAAAANSGEIEWYTPSPYIELARGVMGGIDTDPASSDAANETVKATRYFTEAQDGLSQTWNGRIWLNPPYSGKLVSAFTNHLICELEAKRVKQAIVLVNNATDTGWFAELAGHAAAICFKTGRIAFVNTEGEAISGAAQGQVFLYFGKRGSRFKNEFSEIGWVT